MEEITFLTVFKDASLLLVLDRFINNGYKYNLISCCKQFRDSKYLFTFDNSTSTIPEQIFEIPCILKIFNDLLSDRDKIALIICSKRLNKRKEFIIFNQFHYITKDITDTWFYEKLTKIEVDKIFDFPRGVTHVKFTSKFHNFYSCKNQYKYIFRNITHLIFSENFKGSLDRKIPEKVTHVTISYKYDGFICKKEQTREYVPLVIERY